MSGVPGLGIVTVLTMFSSYPLMHAPGERIAEVGLDRLSPSQADRQLQTTNLHFHALEKTYAPWRLKLRLGATLTHVSGHITQLVGALEEGSLRTQTFESPAWGIGPEVEARFELARAGHLAVTADVSSAVLLYDRRFPAGGDYYNGMFQIGPSVHYTFVGERTLILGFRWVHVSNGQGLGPNNPAYEANGPTLRFNLTY